MTDFSSLQKLQAIDLELDALDDREREMPERERSEKAEIDVERIEKALSDKETLLRKERLAQKKLEDELDGLSSKIDREQQKLYGGSVTIPKELAGIQQEIKSLQNHKDELETSLLEQMEVVEPLEKEMAILSENRTKLADDRDGAKSAYDAVSAEISSSRRGLRAGRDEVLPSVEPGLLEVYERVRKRHRRTAVDLVDGACMGCRTDIPAVQLKKIMETEGLVRCPNCGRILIKKG